MENSATAMVRALELMDAHELADVAALGTLIQRFAEPISRLCGTLAAPDGSYRRSLLHRCARFEVLLLQWGRGSITPIHDHARQVCVFTPLSGALAVDDFKVESQRGRRNAFLLHQTGSGMVTPGALDSRRGKLDVHRVGCAETALSLHVYVRPIDRCSIFRTEPPERQTVALTYDDVRSDLLAVQPDGR